MSRVADGATTRRERILEMLSYIYQAGDKGTTISRVQGHMSLLHGLTYHKTAEYVYEQQMNGLIQVEGGRLKLRRDQFERLLQLLGKEHMIDLGDLDDENPGREKGIV